MADLLALSPIARTMFTLVPVGAHTTQTVNQTNVTLTAPTGASVLLLQCTTDTIRYRIDGTAATTTDGFLLEATDGVERLDLEAGSSVNVFGVAVTSVIQYQWCRPSFYS